MSFWDDLTGKSAAETSRQAAADTYAKQTAAGQQYASDTRSIADQYYQPYINTGNQAQSLISDLLGINGPEAQARAYQNYQSSPGQQWLVDQGTQAIDRSAASKGSLRSGSVLKELMGYGQGMAQQDFGNYYNRLAGVGNQGFGASQGAANLVGQGAAGQFNANYGSAGTVGQGMVAGAQAQQTGLGNLLNAGTFLAGSALGSPTIANLFKSNQRQSSYSQPSSFMQGGQQWPMFT